jgi:hypothetical protein
VNDPESNPGAHENQEEWEEVLNDEEARLVCKVENAEGEIILCYGLLGYIERKFQKVTESDPGTHDNQRERGKVLHNEVATLAFKV